MSKKNTTARLLDNYNTVSRRPTIENEEDRRKIFKSFQHSLRNWLPNNHSAKILDIACGEGSLLSFLKVMGYGNLSGFDISPENVAICHKLGLNFVKKFDALEIENFSKSKYNLIFALDIIEHLPKEKLSQFLEQARKKLTTDGHIVIQTPNMGSIFASFIRYNDLSHEVGLTEKTAVDLLLTAGFSRENIAIEPAWNATTLPGYIREIYLRMIHKIIFYAEDAGRPRIPTKNLLIVGKNRFV